RSPMYRLAAVLLVLLAPAVTASAQPGVAVGSFRYVEKQDPITDEDESLVMLPSRPVDGRPRGVLVWSCFAHGIRMQIQLGGLALSTEHDLTWRFDQDRPVSARVWATSQPTLFGLDTLQYYDFTQRVKTAGRLVMRVLRQDGEMEDLYFDLDGATRALPLLPCVRNLPPPLRRATAPGAGPAAQEPGRPTLHEVRMVGVQGGASGAFAPAQLYVQRGDTVRFVADGATAYNVSFPQALNAPGARLPAPGPFLYRKGQTWTLVVDLPPGQYRFQSDPHAAMGMIGELFVFP
ncbi:MAG TPA: plastocyanin/azurin family copper-binding protein, partial [Longimicrobium sp.]|nr:plastocyanin/azurin family copper-binding protein [Longimicrobium sp.]